MRYGRRPVAAGHRPVAAAGQSGGMNHRVRLRPELAGEEMAEKTEGLGDLSEVRAQVNEDAVRGLTFSDVLPPPLARDTVVPRLTNSAYGAGEQSLDTGNRP
jgi:hypothetical protein